MNIRLLASARQDLVEGYRFYERQAAGIGAYFLDSLFADIDSLVVHAGTHPIVFGRYHRALSRRFPFAVYYRPDGDTIDVYAILDCRRSPAWVRRKLT